VVVAVAVAVAVVKETVVIMGCAVLGRLLFLAPE
jgi:hypothetical protein